MFRYLPVLGERFISKNVYWWRKDNEHYSTNQFLVSPTVTGLRTTRKTLFPDGDDTAFILADSGGFQILTRNLKFSQLDILRWQEEIADVGIMLDYPCYVPGLSERQLDDLYEKSLERTKDNAVILSNTSTSIKLYGAVHGRDFPTQLRWFRELDDVYQFDGYAITISQTSPLPQMDKIITSALMAKEIGRPCHFLGGGHVKALFMFARLAHLLKQDISCDTSSYVVGARFGIYFMPTFLGGNQQSIFMAEDIEKRNVLESLPCRCSACRKSDYDTLLTSDTLRDVHNLHTLHLIKDVAVSVATNDEVFESYFKLLIDRKLPEYDILYNMFVLGNIEEQTKSIADML